MSFIEWIYFFLIYNGLIFAGSHKLFKLAGVPGWHAIIPFYNIIKHLDIIQRPRWWIILVFIPVINLLNEVEQLTIDFEKDSIFNYISIKWDLSKVIIPFR